MPDMFFIMPSSPPYLGFFYRAVDDFPKIGGLSKSHFLTIDDIDTGRETEKTLTIGGL